ncbi:MAG: nitrilase family protein [Bacteroidales bacterium]|nr:nitrilase family protein [Bacteroidales bacterium]
MRIALVQMDIAWENKILNLERAENLLLKDKPEADLVVFPEMFTTGFTMQPATLAEPVDGVTVSRLQKLSDETGYALAGSVITEDQGLYYNRLYFFEKGCDPRWYDKAHLFSPGGEELVYRRGNSHLIVSFMGVNISFQICYDLRFPVWFRNRHNEYDLMINVANWPSARSNVWKSLIVARAIENQCYMAGVNRVGEDLHGNIHQGDSMVVSPRGEVIKHLSGPVEGIVTCDIDIEALKMFREKFPVWRDQDSFILGHDL